VVHGRRECGAQQHQSDRPQPQVTDPVVERRQRQQNAGEEQHGEHALADR
jgi:hypothetical protein